MGRKKISEGGSMTVSAFKPGHPNFLRGKIPNPKGRESSFTEEIGATIVDLIWSGECKSMTAVSRMDGMPTRQTLYAWSKEYPEFGARLLEARTALGDVYDDENEDIKNRMLRGEIEPNAANVAIRTNERKAMFADPYTFSNKSFVEKKETKSVTYTHRIPLDGYTEEEKDAIEDALTKAVLAIEGPNGRDITAGED